MTAFNLRRFIIGNPLATSQAYLERLTKVKALAVFSSDALSSVAYATEEILFVLVLASTGALHFSLPIAIAIAVLLAIVGTSYFQTIHAYPSGGGSYIVAKDNLGTLPGLVAAAALLTDYVLTVSVSILAGVAAIDSWIPELHAYRVPMGLAVVGIVTVVNLRGVRESATIFALPTYLFVLSIFALIAIGLYRHFTGGIPQAVVAQPFQPELLEDLSIFLLLKAFSAGCTALTGVEAISNGIPAFRKPESANAGKTLIAMVLLLGFMFVGVTFLAIKAGAVPSEHETVMSQIGRAIFGEQIGYVLMQVATASILFLAANTSYADFPRLSSLIARDGFLPRQLANVGDRLVFSNGIVVLGLLASSLIVVFSGSQHRLLPLYAVGVFLSFTLSQAGMVGHWFRLKTPKWQREAVINGVGAAATFTVLLVLIVTRFTRGAWIVIVIIPVFVLIFLAIHRHYQKIAAQLSLEAFGAPPRVKHQIVLVPIADVHRGVLHALEFARSISPDVTAVYVETDPEKTARLMERWNTWGDGVRLKILFSPYRSILSPLLDYVQAMESERQPGDVVTLVMPQFVPARGWHNLLHNQTALLVHLALLFRRGTVVIDVPYRLND